MESEVRQLKKHRAGRFGPRGGGLRVGYEVWRRAHSAESTRARDAAATFHGAGRRSATTIRWSLRRVVTAAQRMVWKWRLWWIWSIRWIGIRRW